VLPVGQRLGAAFLADQAALSADARRALVIAAASMDRAAGPVVAALRAENIDAEAVLSEAERVGALTLADGTLTFRHPLIRAAVWQQASAGEQRWAHAALATALKDRPAESNRHRAEATIGFDDHLAEEVNRAATGATSRARLRRGRRADVSGDQGGAIGHPRADEPRHRRRVVPQPKNCGTPRDQHSAEARAALTHRTRRLPGRPRMTRPDRCWGIPPTRHARR